MKELYVRSKECESNYLQQFNKALPVPYQYMYVFTEPFVKRISFLQAVLLKNKLSYSLNERTTFNTATSFDC